MLGFDPYINISIFFYSFADRLGALSMRQKFHADKTDFKLSLHVQLTLTLVLFLKRM